jgi:predicted nucleotide-binding protein
MARRPAAPPPQPAQLTAPAMRAGIERLRKRIDEVQQFDPSTITEQFNIPQVDKLSAAIDDSLVRTFGHGTVEYNRYAEAARFDNGPFNYAYTVPIHHVQQSLSRSKVRSIALLEQAVQSLEEQLGEEAVPETTHQPALQRDLSKVFIVHGHDDAARETVARFVEKLGFEAVILHERPNKGRTIITKFREEATGVGFAVVLMTPDDVGGAPGPAADHLRPRARQNVVFELGFFIGALGPEHVAALVKGNIERPSDFDGVVYISLDNGSWKTDLTRELEAAGYQIDWNTAMRA